MTPTLKQFEDYVVKSGLMTQGELREFLEALPHSQRPRSAEELAKRLVEAGKLTAFQAKCLLQGKTRGLVLGEYVVLEKIGGGGMGVVFKARHRRMDRVVALKTIHPHCMKEPEVVHRFYREVKVAARLVHPNIVLAHDAGEHEGIHYLVMEYVDGRDLGTVVRERGVLPVEEAVDYIVQTARGLAYAHSQGVIHRDIKPGNLLLDRQGRVKILDMGLARLVFGEAQTRTAEQLTGSGQVMGTCDYMAPEQAVSSHRVDHRADIYSLGCTLYRLLTGEPPYKGSTLVEVLLAHREAPIPSLREVRPEVPEELEWIFRRMVAKDPEDRYQSMEEVIAALEICMAKVRVGAREETAPWLKPEPARPADQAERETVGVGRRDQTLLEQPSPPAKKSFADPFRRLVGNPYLQLSALGVGMVLLVGLVLLFLSRPTPPPRTVKQEPTRGAKPTSPRTPPPLPELKPEWEAAWQEAAKKAEEFLSQQEYGKALAEYQAVADRFRSFELATRLQEVRGQIEEKARTAYVAAEQEARGLLGEKRFAEARAALQPVLERFGIPEYVEPAQRLLGQIEAAEREFAATTAAQAAENMSATEPSGPAEAVAEEKPATPPERTAEERAARAELEKYLALRAEWEEAFRPVEERVASWDFARALEALNSLPLGETPLAERISSRRVEIERMLRLKGQIIQAIQQAHPKLDKMRLLLRGVNGPIVAADDEGITAELPGGKKELHRWGQLSEKSLGRVLPLGIRPEAGEDWLAAGLIALVAKAPTLAEEYFAQAAKRGIKVEDYAGSLVEVAVARAADELARGDQALKRGQEAQKEGKTAEALRHFDEAENQYQAAEKFLRELESRYSQSPQYQALHSAAQAISLLSQKALQECVAERLYTQALQLYENQELHDVKPIVQELKAKYSPTLVFQDRSRKPSVAELDAATASLGPRLTVALTGKADFRSIQAAIDAAKGGELIEILDNGRITSIC